MSLGFSCLLTYDLPRRVIDMIFVNFLTEIKMIKNEMMN